MYIEKKWYFNFSRIKILETQIWRKKVKRQPTITIWKNLVELEKVMLYTKI